MGMAAGRTPLVVVSAGRSLEPPAGRWEAQNGRECPSSRQVYSSGCVAWPDQGPLCNPLAIRKTLAYLIVMRSTKLGRRAKDATLDVPRFLLGDLAAVTDMTETTLKAWLSREPKVIPLGPYDKPALGKGSAREFTLRRVISVAIIAELVRLGIAPAKAGFWAYTLTDVKLWAGMDWLDESTVLFASPNADSFTFGTESTSIAEALEFFSYSERASTGLVGAGQLWRHSEAR